MYQKILNSELRFPSYVSSEAQSILDGVRALRLALSRRGSNGGVARGGTDWIVALFRAVSWPSSIQPSQLLTRDPTKRLGTKEAAEIKKHPFFRNIDWDKLFKKEVEPTFKPKVKSEADVSQVRASSLPTHKHKQRAVIHFILA
jgi:hypothetical protein